MLIGLMDDIYDFILKFVERIDDFEEVIFIINLVILFVIV